MLKKIFSITALGIMAIANVVAVVAPAKIAPVKQLANVVIENSISAPEAHAISMTASWIVLEAEDIDEATNAWTYWVNTQWQGLKFLPLIMMLYGSTWLFSMIMRIPTKVFSSWWQ